MTHDISITERFAELIDGPWYEYDGATAALIEPHIPSDRDLSAWFRQRLHALHPGVECLPWGKQQRYFTVGGRNYERSKRYLRVELPDTSAILPDLVRRAYYDAADVLACAVAVQTVEMQAKHERVTVRWPESRLLHHHSSGDRRRLALDPCADRVVALLCAYYVVAPLGEQETES